MFVQGPQIRWVYLSPFGITPISLEFQVYLCFCILIVFILTTSRRAPPFGTIYVQSSLTQKVEEICWKS
jgi:hypothetical protein